MRNDRPEPLTGEPLILVEWVRFACALGVVALHYGVTFWHAPSIRSWHLLGGLQYRASGEAMFAQGWIGVELFFVISGMMVARSAGHLSRAAFLRRRVDRLVPAAWICATITLLVVGAGLGWHAELLTDWVRSLAFCPVLQQVDDSYWTLGIETSFYLAVAIVLGKRGADLTGLAVMIGGASALFWLSDFAGFDPWDASGDRLLQLVLLPHGCFFALGMMLARRGARTGVVEAIGAATLLGACSIEIIRHAQSSVAMTGIETPTALPLALFLLGIAALVAAPRMQRHLALICSPATARRWGSATYPLYLVHQDAGAGLVGWLGRGALSVPMALIVTTLVMIGISLIIGDTLEPALRRRLARPAMPTLALTPS